MLSLPFQFFSLTYTCTSFHFLSFFLLHCSPTLIVSSTSPWSSSFPPFSPSLLLSLPFSPSLTSTVVLHHPSHFFQIILSWLGVNLTPMSSDLTSTSSLVLSFLSSSTSFFFSYYPSLFIPILHLLTCCFLSLLICNSRFAIFPLDPVFQLDHFFLPVISLHLSLSHPYPLLICTRFLF